MSNYIHGTGSEEQVRLSSLNKMTNDSFISFLNLSGNEKIIDIGCGMGDLASQIAAGYNEISITGIEISDEQLNKIPQNIPNLRRIKGDASDIPFEDNSFDLAYMRYLLEHVANPERVIRESKRILKPDGRLYLQENNILCMQFYPSCDLFTSVWQKFSVLQEKLGGDALIGKKLFCLAKKTGFRNIQPSIEPEVHYFGSNTFFLWIENLIQNIIGAKALLIKNNLCKEEEVTLAMEELNNFRNNEYASTYFYWNRLIAYK
ncbi:MAG: methyltransferase domain-containing protein [Prevotellaceae bacterium]|jgi:ubiquinone/menaquinone biosynthesis C-methylase UbiE|nr:methyltransferase domain-containing protein [Prevotellaceae bacterium]